MKLMTLAACATGLVIALALFVHFTPGESTAEPQNTRIVGGADRSVARTTSSAPAEEPQQPQADFSFHGIEYFHRSSQSNERMEIHEFTPDGQSDLSAWTDMVTVTHYRDVKDADGLFAIANIAFSMYESAGGNILVTDSVAATESKSAEHLLVGLLFAHGIIEAVFNRFIMHEGTGTAVMFSRRVYGEGVGDEMSDWLRDHGQATEERLMSLDAAKIIKAVPQQ